MNFLNTTKFGWALTPNVHHGCGRLYQFLCEDNEIVCIGSNYVNVGKTLYTRKQKKIMYLTSSLL